MYPKIILFSLISISLYINPIRKDFTFQAIPSLVPLSLCDKRYSIEMDRALNKAYRNIGNSASKADLTKVAEEYMILIKHQEDIDTKIRAIEAKIFNLDSIRILRIPLQNYIACKDHTYHTNNGIGENRKDFRNVEVNSKIPTVTRLGYPLFISAGPCDSTYSNAMAKTLDDMKSILTVDLIQIAEEYMILIKQQQDVDVRIRQLEQKVLSLSVITILRRPIQEYNRCKNRIRTGDYPIDFYR